MSTSQRLRILFKLFLASILASIGRGQDCGLGNWFRGFTEDAGITFSIIAVKPSCEEVEGGPIMKFFAAAGSTTSAQTLNPAMTNPIGAVVLTYDYNTNVEYFTHVQTSVTYTNSLSVTQTANVVGVKALTIRHEGCTSSSKSIMGVFEPEDGQTLIFFRLDSSTFSTFVSPGHETGYGCSLTNQHIQYWDSQHSYITYQKCDGTATYLANFNSDDNRMLTGEMIIKQDPANTITPVGVATNLNGVVAAAVETGSVSLLHVIKFAPFASPVMPWLNLHECYISQDYSAFPQAQPKSVIIRANYAIVAAEYDGCSVGCGLTFIAFNVDQLSCGDLTVTRTLIDAAVAAQFKLLAHQAVDDGSLTRLRQQLQSVPSSLASKQPSSPAGSPAVQLTQQQSPILNEAGEKKASIKADAKPDSQSKKQETKESLNSADNRESDKSSPTGDISCWRNSRANSKKKGDKKEEISLAPQKFALLKGS